MEQKLVKAPFDIELAKKITNREVKGRIITRVGQDARILCFDRISEDLPIIALVDNGKKELPEEYMKDGRWCKEEIDDFDLMLEIPEYMTFKVGDVLTSCGCPFIFKGYKHDGCSFYAGINAINLLVFPFKEDSKWSLDKSNCTFCTESEKQRLINALKESTDERAKDCLKMLGIENSPILSNSSKIGKKEDLARDYSKRVSNGRVVIQDYTACAYMAGWDACMEYLAGLPLDESMNEIMNNCEGKED